MPPRHGSQLYWQQDMTDSHHKVVVANAPPTTDRKASIDEGNANHNMIVNARNMNLPTKGTVTIVKKTSKKRSLDSSKSVEAGLTASKNTSSTSAGVKRVRKHYKVGNAKDNTTKSSNGTAKHGGNTPPPTKKRKAKKRVQVVLSKTNKLEASMTGVNSRTEDDALDSDTSREAAERAAAARKKARPNARLPTRELRTAGSSSTTPSTTTKMVARQSEPRAPEQETDEDEESGEEVCHDDSAEDPPPAPVTPPRDPIELENSPPQSPPPPPPPVDVAAPPENAENEPVEHSSELSWDDPVALDDAASIIAVGRFLSVPTATVETAHDVQDSVPPQEEVGESSTENDDRATENAAHQRTSMLQTVGVEIQTAATAPTEGVSASESIVDTSDHVENNSVDGLKLPNDPRGPEPGLREDLKTNGEHEGNTIDDSVDIGKLDTLDPDQAVVLPSKENEFQEDLFGCDDKDLPPEGTTKLGDRVAAQRLYYQHLEDNGYFSRTEESFTAGYSFSFGTVHSSREIEFSRSGWVDREFY